MSYDIEKDDLNVPKSFKMNKTEGTRIWNIKQSNAKIH